MGALGTSRQVGELRIKTAAFPLAASVTAHQGGMACADVGAGEVTPAAHSTSLLKIGEFAETVDNSASTATSQVLVSLDREVIARWYDNDTGSNAVGAADLFDDCYLLDDHTVTTVTSGNSKAGRVWAVDAVKGVAVESYTL